MRNLMKSIATVLVIASVTFIGTTFGSGSAQAQRFCGPHEKIVKQLESGYQEARRGYGLAVNGTLVELFVSEEKGTWTFMYTRPDGITCLMANGGDWENMSPIEKVDEEVM